MTRNTSIQGLRGAAVLAVFAYHIHRAVVTGGVVPVHVEYDAAVNQLLELGRLGVDLFFMISGYLITASLIKHSSVRRFLGNRVLRIYPAFLVPHLIMFLVGPLIGHGWLADLTPLEYLAHFLSNMLFLPGVFELPIAQIVAWSLSYEFAFYLYAAGLYAGLRAWNETDRFAGRMSVAACLSAWAVLTGVALWHHPRAWFFIAGATVFFVQRRVESDQRAKVAVGRSGDLLLLMIGLAGFVGLFEAVFAVAVLAGGIAFLALVRERTVLSGLLQRPSLQYLGQISYSFYLWHTLVMFPLKALFRAGGLSTGIVTADIALFSSAALVGSLLVAHASYRVCEQMVTAVIAHWLRGATANTLGLTRRCRHVLAGVRDHTALWPVRLRNGDCRRAGAHQDPGGLMRDSGRGTFRAPWISRVTGFSRSQ